MFLDRYRLRFEEEVFRAIERMGEKNTLRDACEYAVFSGGKRLRPMIVLMTADALGFGFDVLPAAVSVEFFHTASLIVDDLPCMDNDSFRRGRPSLHKVFAESVAILASYALIAEGYGGIHRNSELMKKGRCSHFAQKANEAALLSLQAATRCAGVQGAVNGQFLDLHPPGADWGAVRKIISQKTATLFEISFLFGWLFGGGDPAALKELGACSLHLGTAFQIADDLEDAQIETGGSNIAALLGKEEAISLFEREIACFKDSLKKLGLWTEPFQEFYALLETSVSSASRFYIFKI